MLVCFHELQKLSKEELIERIEGALMVAFETAQFDGTHHKMWTIDQMVRRLNGARYMENGVLDGSEAYSAFVQEFCVDDEGNEYEWDMGVAP